MFRSLSACSLAILLLLAGCFGSSHHSSASDAGVDTVADTDFDIDVDSQTDADRDPEIDTSHEAGTDVGADADGDGYASLADGGDDCNDGHPGIHPGAWERCDSTDWDCDGVAQAFGVVTFTAADGTATDMSADFAAGTEAAPSYHYFDADGTLAICYGTYFGQIVVEDAAVDVVGTGGVDLHAPAVGPNLIIASDRPVSVSGLRLYDGTGWDLGEGDTAGGGVYVHQDNAPVTLSQLVVEATTATWGGGLFVGANSAVTLVDGQVTLCAATDSGGAAFVNEGGTLTLGEVAFLTNEAKEGWGGGVFLADGASVVGTPGVTRVSFNTAIYGGGLAMSDGSSVEGLRVLSNQAEYGAGADVWGSVSIDADLSYNNAAGWGGGLFVEDGATVEVRGGHIGSNEADTAAGVYVGVGSTVTGTLQVSGNIANSWCGGVYLAEGATVSLGGGAIDENRAWGQGGVVMQANSSLVGPGTICGNASLTDHGGLLAMDGSVSVSDVVICNNSAASIGGGVAAWWGATLQLDRVEVTGNVALQDGGLSVAEASASLTEGAVTANRVINPSDPTAGGVGIWFDGHFQCQGTDWGNDTDGSTNSGYDVFTYGSNSTYEYSGSGHTLSCTTTGCN